jgi:hypothetical protein
MSPQASNNGWATPLTEAEKNEADRAMFAWQRATEVRMIALIEAGTGETVQQGSTRRARAGSAPNPSSIKDRQ